MTEVCIAIGWVIIVATIAVKWLREGRHQHQWGKYEEPVATRFPEKKDFIDGDMLPAWTSIDQKRTCETCGLVEWKRVA